MTVNEFAAQWRLDDLPACPAGLVILRDFAEAAPDLYAVAREAHFIDVTDRDVAAHPFWQVFEDYFALCGDCNEV